MRVKSIIFSIANYLLQRKNNNTVWKSDVAVKIELKDCTFHTNSGNTVMIETKKGTEYFRQCAVHKEKKAHIMEAVDFFFDCICCEGNSAVWKKAVYHDLADENNFRRILSLNTLYENHFQSMRMRTFDDAVSVGIPSLAQLDFFPHLVDFIKFIKAIINDYEQNNYVKRNGIENFRANRQLATRALAEIMKCEEMIPNLKMCELAIKHDGKTIKMTGTLMEQGGDTSPLSLDCIHQFDIDSNFLRQITTLEYFDAISYQQDHRKGNYNVSIDKSNRICGVSAFDNDAPLTFFILPFCPSKTYVGCSAVIKDGKINRPCMDKGFYNALCSIAKKDIDANLSCYLSSLQRYALWKRICQMRKAARKSAETPGFLVGEEEWPNVSANAALDAKYGRTYYDYFLNVDEKEIVQKRAEATL